ncbi:NrsF family protein [Rhodoplanes roseus]|uniref:Anti-sigma F factor n=1 Tax=Rhodoplanes roseus TaxID=29409 RepID=A0A327KPB7_9BRAD|nr:NrsF family protein [Rhodoplanes roseus]RAI40257.1 hypothetical protein CH341_24120 [Rhodoplanes roseus]
MRTDDLVRALVADGPIRERPLAVSLPAFAAVGLVGTLALFVVVLGLRPDIGAAAQTVRFVLKPVEMGLFAALGGLLAIRLAQPGSSTRGLVAGLAVAAGLLAAGVVGELVAVPAADWGARLVGSNAAVCLASIPLLAAPLLAATLWALRRGAPLHPARAGAAAGLFSATAGATLYGLHCPDDSPFFVAAWYSLATAVVVVAGALAGRRWLRW